MGHILKMNIEWCLTIIMHASYVNMDIGAFRYRYDNRFTFTVCRTKTCVFGTAFGNDDNLRK
jgi:hypothetical protein